MVLITIARYKSNAVNSGIIKLSVWYGKAGLSVLDNGRISSVQLLFILFTVVGATALLYAAPGLAAIAGPDGGIAAFLGGFYGLLVVLVAVTLGKRFPAQVFTEYLPGILGRIPGKALAAVYTVMLIGLIVVNLGEGSFFIHILLFDLTPIAVLDTVLVVAAIYGAYLGIECIARQNGLASISWMLSLLLLCALAVQDMNFSNLKPVLENGLLPILRAGVFHSSFWGDGFILLLLFPYLNQKQEALKTGLLYLGSIMIIAGMVTAVNEGVFGDLVASHLVFPFEAMVGYISIGGFIERSESLFMLVFIVAIILKLAVFYHAAAIAVSSTLGLKSYRLTLIPIALITVILRGVLFPSYLKLVTFLFHPLPIYAAVVQFAIPALVLLVAALRKTPRPGAG
jgi:spore germination protein KB